MPDSSLPPVPALPLATGDLSTDDAAELRALLQQIEGVTGIRGSGYKERYFRRRLGVRMRRLGLERYGDYAERLRTDPAEYERLVDAIAINVSRFYRNAEAWTLIRTGIVPALFELDEREVRIWSAGTASGEEAYTMAMVLAEHAEETGRADRLDRFDVLGTDIDTDALSRARRGVYEARALDELPDELRHWFDPGPPCRVVESLKRWVRFEALDMTMDAPSGPRQLVLCRNVLIYLEREVQEQVLERVADVVPRDGFLVLGQAEMLVGPARNLFRPVATRERVYRRL